MRLPDNRGMSDLRQDKIRVLMVCLGNICRSPTAEAMLRRKVREAGLDDRVEVDSAGTPDYHVGSPPDRRAIAHGERRGLKMKSLRGRQVSREDFERFDFILAMDEDNLAELQRIRPPGSRATVALLMSYAPQAGSTVVPDPYYGSADGFERVLDLVESAAEGFLGRVVPK
jgi:protein-tyrosine phosphatase